MYPSTSRRAGRSAFTLVELLVVIAIIALLIAILLPALGKAKQQAMRIACAANLRSMGQAMAIYINDSGYYPGHATISPRGPTAIWPTRLRKAMKGGNLMFYCPAQPAGFQWQRKFGTGADYATASMTGYGYEVGELLLSVHLVPFSYGYNDWGAGNPQPSPANYPQRGLGGDIGNWGGYNPSTNPNAKEIRASNVRRSTEMIAIMDGTTDGVWDFNVDPENRTEHPARIHSNGSNVLFCDGHVLWFRQKDLIWEPGQTMLKRQTIGRMWNIDNLP
jgi:prepilin-type processing-associated H-X9-DG protein/prepilin-type N-terminal cleavage/methylation domain-containing protein